MKIYILVIFWTVSILSIAFVATAQNAKFSSVDNAEFAKTISDKEVQLIDVRTAVEFAEGHIHNAQNIDVRGADFDKQVEKLAKNRPVALYCRSGARSKTAAQKFVDKGYTVVELDKGISNWNGEVTR